MAKRRPIVMGQKSAQVMLMQAARRVTALERKRSAAKRALALVQAELRQARRELRAATGAVYKDAESQTPPMRLFGETEYPEMGRGTTRGRE